MSLTGNARALALIDRWRTHRDPAARATVVAQYMPLVHRWVKRYPHSRFRVEDATQEGTIGLLLAIDHFKPEHNVAFGLYAALWIRNRLTSFIREDQVVRRLRSRGARVMFSRIGKIDRELSRAGEESTPEAIAAMGGVPVRAVEDVLGFLRGDVWADKRVDDEEALVDLLVAPGTPADELLDEARTTAKLRADLTAALELLDDRERTVIRRRFLEEPPASLRTVGATFGLSGERVRQIENRALRKIAKRMGVTAAQGRKVHGAGSGRPRRVIDEAAFAETVDRLVAMRAALPPTRHRVFETNPQYANSVIDAADAFGTGRVAAALRMDDKTIRTWRRALRLRSAA